MKELPEYRDIAEKRNLLEIGCLAVIEQAANHEALPIGEFYFCLNPSYGQGRNRRATDVDRVREITRLEQQTEKLNALGKLAGNLAHEMNNPASAAQRAASGLLDELSIVITAALDGSSAAPTVFNSGDADLGPAPLERMTLKSHEVMDSGALWLRYALEAKAT